MASEAGRHTARWARLRLLRSTILALLCKYQYEKKRITKGVVVRSSQVVRRVRSGLSVVDGSVFEALAEAERSRVVSHS